MPRRSLSNLHAALVILTCVGWLKDVVLDPQFLRNWGSAGAKRRRNSGWRGRTPPVCLATPRSSPPECFAPGALPGGYSPPGGLDPASDRGGPEGPARHPSCFWDVAQRICAASPGINWLLGTRLGGLWPGVVLLLGGAPRQGPQGLWRQRARRPAVGLASTAGRWLASPTVSRWASHHPGPRPSCGFRAWGLGPAPCQSGTGTRFMNRLPARGGGLPLAGRFHERKASRHHSGVVGPGLMTVSGTAGTRAVTAAGGQRESLSVQ